MPEKPVDPSHSLEVKLTSDKRFSWLRTRSLQFDTETI